MKMVLRGGVGIKKIGREARFYLFAWVEPVNSC
jgi:hypothetical protein